MRVSDFEARLDLSQRENRALRQLLSGLGIDEQSQQRYLESSSQRDAVRAILRSETTGDANSDALDEAPERVIAQAQEANDGLNFSQDTLDPALDFNNDGQDVVNVI